MKIACDKCLTVVEGDKNDFLKISTTYFTFYLCASCEDAFWRSVDHNLPPIKKPQPPKGAE